MAIGYQANGICFSTQQLAAQYWQTKYPYQDGTTVYYLSTLSVNPTGLMTFTIKNSSGATVITNGTAQLTQCPDQGLLQDYPLQDIIFVLSLIVKFALGIFTGQQR